jgi:acyl dehydratase
VELRESPRLGGLYRSAALGALRRGRPDTLPDEQIVLRDVAVDRAHLAEYQRVCGFRVCDALPATYPHVLAFPLSMALLNRPDFPFPVIGLVHVANRITVLQPLDSGTRLTLRVQAEDLRPHERGQQFNVVATGSVGEEVVWRGRSVYLRRSPGGGPKRAPASAEPPAAKALWRVPRQVGIEYAKASGDQNPIHTSRVLARAFGFPRPIAHGMWTKARCLAALDGRLPELYTVDVEFKLPILLPATVGFAATQDRRADSAGADSAGAAGLASSLLASGTGWRFAVNDARSGKPHVAGVVVA